MQTPKISIIIPVYNREFLIVETFLSIKNQTYSNFECLCIDDGSTDNSLLKLNELIASIISSLFFLNLSLNYLGAKFISENLITKFSLLIFVLILPIRILIEPLIFKILFILNIIFFLIYFSIKHIKNDINFIKPIFENMLSKLNFLKNN